jgi:hypothetical protein
MEATTLADFDLLRDSRQDIRRQLWTEPSRREGMNLYFGIKRAKEEIVRLNVEIRRLLTFMIDDHRDFYRAIAANFIVDPILACELSWQWQYRHRIHSQIAFRLRQTASLKGFTGSLLHGVREGRELTADSIGLPPWAEEVLGLTEKHGDYDGDDDVQTEVEADLVVQLMENITVQPDADK